MTLTVGYLLGMHLLSSGLNNSHFTAEINESVMVYQNSFNRASVAVYKPFQSGPLKLRLGVTTGYYDTQVYNGVRYSVPFATSSGVALFVVPSYETENFAVAVIGDSINAGLIFRIR